MKVRSRFGLAIRHTAYGDGVYIANTGDQFCVDAGLIGIVPVETVEYLRRDDYNLDKMGLFVTFDEDFTATFYDGRFRFGSIIIETDYSDDEEEDAEDDYYDDEE